MKKTIKKLKNHPSVVSGTFSSRSRLLFVACFVIIGMIALFLAHAATPTATTEPEKGNGTGTTIVNDNTASGGQAVKFGAVSTSGTIQIANKANPLPFDLPSTATLRASNKKVFANYHPYFTLSINNVAQANDWYAKQQLAICTGSISPVSCGNMRERPIQDITYPSSNAAANSSTCPLPSPEGWRLDDMKTEVRRAIAAGIDGFLFDALQLPGEADYRVCQNPFILMNAANAVDTGFKLVLQPDMSGLDSRTPQQLADFTVIYNKYPAAYRMPDGRLLVSPVQAEKWTIAQWQSYISILKGKGINIAFWPEFLANTGSNMTAYHNAFGTDPVLVGYGNWGAGFPAANTATGLANQIAAAKTNGNELWMQPVMPQTVRPASNMNWYDESNNSENLRLMWGAAVKGADWVQIVTWNDYSEGAETEPSTHTGYGPLDISSYYLTWMKTGTAPTIKRDVVYVSHRVQPFAATPTGPQTIFMKNHDPSTPSRDTVEVLSFLAGPATVNVTVGGTTTSYSAPLGVFSKTVPLAAGTVKVTVTRSNRVTADVTSPFPIVSSPYIQDLQYHYVVSSRDGNQNL